MTEEKSKYEIRWHAEYVEKSLTEFWKVLNRILREKGEKERELFTMAKLLEYTEMLGYLLDCHLRVPEKTRDGHFPVRRKKKRTK